MKGWVVLVMIVLAVFELPGAAAQGLSPSQCSSMKNNLRSSCKGVVLFLNPSANCCQLVREANVQCICQFVTAKLIAALGGQERTLRLIRGCGRTIPRNFKCGSVTTPP